MRARLNEKPCKLSPVSTIGRQPVDNAKITVGSHALHLRNPPMLIFSWICPIHKSLHGSMVGKILSCQVSVLSSISIGVTLQGSHDGEK